MFSCFHVVAACRSSVVIAVACVCVDMDVPLLLMCLCAVALAQDCKVGGKRCIDHEQCCGGCCVEGECIDTFRPCQSSMDVCRDHTCRGEESCVVYVPPHCPGCEPLALCRLGDA